MKGSLLLKPKKVLRLYLTWHCIGIAEAPYVALLAYVLAAMQIWSEGAVMKATLPIRKNHFFIPTSPCIASGCLKYHTGMNCPRATRSGRFFQVGQ
jgi:hypothetical protein